MKVTDALINELIGSTTEPADFGDISYGFVGALANRIKDQNALYEVLDKIAKKYFMGQGRLILGFFNSKMGRWLAESIIDERKGRLLSSLKMPDRDLIAKIKDAYDEWEDTLSDKDILEIAETWIPDFYEEFVGTEDMNESSVRALVKKTLCEASDQKLFRSTVAYNAARDYIADQLGDEGIAKYIYTVHAVLRRLGDEIEKGKTEATRDACITAARRIADDIIDATKQITPVGDESNVRAFLKNALAVGISEAFRDSHRINANSFKRNLETLESKKESAEDAARVAEFQERMAAALEGFASDIRTMPFAINPTQAKLGCEHLLFHLDSMLDTLKSGCEAAVDMGLKGKLRVESKMTEARDDYSKRFESFVRELEKLTRKYGVAIETTGGIWDCKDDLADFKGYSDDWSSGDLEAKF